jgi:hypothetical protein
MNDVRMGGASVFDQRHIMFALVQSLGGHQHYLPWMTNEELLPGLDRPTTSDSTETSNNGSLVCRRMHKLEHERRYLVADFGVYEVSTMNTGRIIKEG